MLPAKEGALVGPWTICVERAVAQWIQTAKNRGGADAEAARAVEHMLDLLEQNGRTANTAKKLNDVDLWEVRPDAYRLFFKFASGRRIAVGEIRKKGTGKWRQKVYQQIERKVADYVYRLEAELDD